MVYANENHLKLKTNYLFAEVAKRVSAFQKENPNVDVIKLGIGDVTRPLPSAMFEGIDMTALLSWLDKANVSSFGKLFMS